jgi:hypothetical protein
MGACETTPTTQCAPGGTSQRPPHGQHAQQRLFLATDHRPPLAGIKLVRPRPRLPARRCGRSSLTPPTPRHTPAAARKRHNYSPHPNPATGAQGHRVNSARPLDN